MSTHSSVSMPCPSRSWEKSQNGSDQTLIRSNFNEYMHWQKLDLNWSDPFCDFSQVLLVSWTCALGSCTHLYKLCSCSTTNRRRRQRRQKRAANSCSPSTSTHVSPARSHLLPTHGNTRLSPRSINSSSLTSLAIRSVVVVVGESTIFSAHLSTNTPYRV